ncbi:MAG TPA: hypothetical protein VLF63_02520 [Patescibacteria group bacterium]|nr:hypothetical protein [Patescibacteria group bacterium]
MSKKIILTIFSLLILAVFIGVSYSFGDIKAVQSMTLKRVNPTQLAVAMKGDYFYSKYRKNTLIVKGQVKSVSMISNTSQVTFETNSDYITYCNMSHNVIKPNINSTITVLSEGGSAKRVPNGVQLVDCLFP